MRIRLAVLSACVLPVAGMPSVAKATPPAYVTAQDLMASFQEVGVKFGSGRRLTVLDVVCSGSGYHRGNFPYERYHIFECYITTARFIDKRFRVTMFGGQHWYYSYQQIPGY